MRSTHFIKCITDTRNPLNRFLSFKSRSLYTGMSGPNRIMELLIYVRKMTDDWAVGLDIHGLKVGRFSLQDFDIEVIDPVIVDRLDFSRVDILETFLVTKSMLVLADISQPFTIIQWYRVSKLWSDSKTKLCCKIVIITSWQFSKIVISHFEL